MNAIAIAARNVTRNFGHYTALNDVTLEVNEGEFVSLVGPSGCGKTTLLRILGGFDQPNRGTVKLAGANVTDTPPERRPTNMVFQRGALFPHLSVAENIGYALKRQKVAKPEIDRRVDEMLALIRLAGFGHRKPSELSGGQAQRVALARALIGRPQVLLLDEPFSALDLSLRKELQLELKRIHREFSCAFVFVTHDQEEALVLSDRIAIMNQGKILQYGSPMSIYRDPEDVFAAQFIGEMNLLPGVVGSGDGERLTVTVGTCAIELPAGSLQPKVNEPVIVSIRPENVGLETAAGGRLTGVVDEVVYVGSRWRVKVNCPVLSMSVWAEVPGATVRREIERGDEVDLTLRTEHSRLLPAH